MHTVTELFLDLVTYDTTAHDDAECVPSTDSQREFANVLAERCRAIGLTDVTVSDHSYVYAVLPSNCSEPVPTIGFVAHMDTSPEVTGRGVTPRIVESYGGGVIVLSDEHGVVISPTVFPEIEAYIGQDIIVTDGTTLLGADDKAGIAEILTAMSHLVNNPEIKHGAIKIAFTPDEEVGRGADYFDVAFFDADYAYTVDGGAIGELEYENFNAAKARINIKGKSVHPGTAKGTMINAAAIAVELAAMFPVDEVPERTEGYEGFYHLHAIESAIEHGKLSYIIRDFDMASFERRKLFVADCVQKINNRYGDGTAILEMSDQYYNMEEKVREHFHIVERARKAMERVGVTPVIKPIRGGTDGSRLSYMGLICPNIFAGGHNFHGVYEYLPIPSMEKAVAVIIEISRITACEEASKI